MMLFSQLTPYKQNAYQCSSFPNTKQCFLKNFLETRTITNLPLKVFGFSSSLTPPNSSSLNLSTIDHNLNLENGNNSKRNSETGVPNLDVQQQPQQYIPELHVYTHRGNQQRVEDLVHPATCHNSHSNSGNSQVPLLAINSDDLPIALRKGICSSTQHPIAQVVKYNHLSSSMKALVSNLAEVKIPKTIEEALLKKEWKMQQKKK
ncbi:hypothetical protein CK203_049064 [Vitis vinifera]|uniref:Uncharacterized protein n=1 Tax=Vitis vinifera TaxID=29760 RepID=A0A438HC52_VITVI|nr:hypothetical protein CK203_049064 [Vitis vinifera]